MSDSLIQYQTRAEIEGQIELARRQRSVSRPSLAAFSSVAIYLGIAALVAVGMAMNGTSDVGPHAMSAVVAQLATP